MTKCPKTADMMQDVFAAGGDMALVPVACGSGIRFEINAASHSFKSFHQITPSHRRHIPVRRERCIKWAVF